MSRKSPPLPQGNPKSHTHSKSPAVKGELRLSAVLDDLRGVSMLQRLQSQMLTQIQRELDLLASEVKPAPKGQNR